MIVFHYGHIHDYNSYVLPSCMRFIKNSILKKYNVNIESAYKIRSQKNNIGKY
jgi:hypothetical protein